MTTVTPAQILYIPEGETVERIINFDAVIEEGHAAKAKVTKFPVQEGFHVSNHSIRENRIVSLKGMISNVQFDLGDAVPKTQYGSNATAFVKNNLEALIHSGLQCRVVTNLGDYNPVVFTSFKTAQKAGMVDSMEFTITGEEIILANAATFTAPTPITFQEVQGAERDVYVERLNKAEIFVDECDKISKGSYTVGQDYVINDVNTAGKSVETSYIFMGIHPTTKAEMYEIHVSESSVSTHNPPSARVAEVSPCLVEGFDKSLFGGIAQISGCLLAEAALIAQEAVEEVIDTSMGKLTKSIRGLLYDTVEFAGGPDSIGGMLTTAGVSCVVRGISGNTDAGNYNPGESLPTTDQIIEGAAIGLGFSEPRPEVVSLTQIQCACKDDQKFDVDASLIPIG